MDANEIKAAAGRLERLYGGESYESVYGQDRTGGGLAAMDEAALVQAMIARLAADEANPIRTTAIEMVDICLDPTATDDEKSMAASTILEAVYPQMLAEHVVLMQFRSRRIEADEAERIERIEREKPIDEAWLRSIGFRPISEKCRLWQLHERGGRDFEVWQENGDWLLDVSVGPHCKLGGIKKVGLLDLLAALNLNPKGE